MVWLFFLILIPCVMLYFDFHRSLIIYALIAFSVLILSIGFIFSALVSVLAGTEPNTWSIPSSLYTSELINAPNFTMLKALAIPFLGAVDAIRIMLHIFMFHGTIFMQITMFLVMSFVFYIWGQVLRNK